MKIRCSMLPTLMTGGQGKTWKSAIKKIAIEDYFGIENRLENKYLEKGKRCENESIELYNRVFDLFLEKNTERKENDYLTGECDLIDGKKIIDIKTSWSLETFPMLQEDINIKDYEMQLRGYMLLFDCESAEVAYCMVNTPEDLLTKFDNTDLHIVDFIEDSKLITVSETIYRDAEIEEKIKSRCEEAINYYYEIIRKIDEKNS